LSGGTAGAAAAAARGSGGVGGIHGVRLQRRRPTKRWSEEETQLLVELVAQVRIGTVYRVTQAPHGVISCMTPVFVGFV
jgi:hypothetical protein